MSEKGTNLLIEARIELLENFRSALEKWRNGAEDKAEKSDLKSYINRNVVAVRNAVREAGTQKRITVGPPPAVGGLVVQNADPFDGLLQSFYGLSVIPIAIDAIEEAIGVYQHAKNNEGLISLPSREVIDVEASIERALRPSFRTSRPTKERDVQDAVENIFRAVGIDYLREQEVAPVGPKASRPDFVIGSLDLAVEIKIATEKHGIKEIQEEMNSYIVAYRTKWRRVLFIVYDADGVIEDPYQFRRENIRLFGVSVVVAKH